MKSLNRKIFFSILALTLASMACATPDVSSLLNPMPSDDFSNSNGAWGTGTGTDSSVEIIDGGLHINVFTPFYISWSQVDSSSYENTHMEVSVQNSSADPEAFFGFVCNEQGSTNNFYYVGVSSDGYYAFYKSHVVGEDDILKKGISDVISSSPSSMRLGLDCKNGSMTLYVNGQVIDSVSDSDYPSGLIGLLVYNDDQQNGASVIFDDFVSSKIE